jgi:hypothetical protein
MTEDLFCSICVDAKLTEPALAELIVELTGGRFEHFGVTTPWARIGLDNDYGDFSIRAANPDDPLGWRILLEIMPVDGASHADVVHRVTELMNALRSRGFRVLAQADYADELPGAGEVIGPT